MNGDIKVILMATKGYGLMYSDIYTEVK